MVEPVKVVCVARTLGAGGENIAQTVSAGLGFRYADDLIIQRSAEAAGVYPGKVIEAEKSPGFVSRILDGLRRFPDPSLTPDPTDDERGADFEHLIGNVIREIAAQGGSVLVAHGASMAVAGMPGVFRVLVTGSPETRASRIAEERGIDVAKAKKAVRDSDDQRKSFLRRFYDIHDELPHHYDLVINTDMISAEQAADLILAVARGAGVADSTSSGAVR